MARSFDNIDSRRKPANSTRGAGCYVGYATLSGVWYISGKTGNYYARCTTGRAAGTGAFYARTLAEVSTHLRSW